MSELWNRRRFVRHLAAYGTVALGAGIRGGGALHAAAQSPASAPMRNRRLADIPDDTWVRLRVSWPDRKGGYEVPWTYDAKNQRFVHYGGCTSPYTNEGWVFDLGTETWTMRDPHAPGAPGRPGAACSRGLAFDSRRDMVWVMGGATPLSGQDMGLFSYDVAANRWTKVTGKWTKEARDNRGQQANTLVYDSVDDLLVTLGKTPSSLNDVWIFDPANKTWRGGSIPGEKYGLNYRPATFDPQTESVVILLDGAPGQDAKGTPFIHGETWTYHVKTDTWKNMQPATSPRGRRYHGMCYDSRNKVHILAGGSRAFGEELYNDTWVYDAKANTWTEMQNFPGQGVRMLFDYDVEHNVALMADRSQGMWVYRYKR